MKKLIALGVAAILAALAVSRLNRQVEPPPSVGGSWEPAEPSVP